MLLRNLDTQQWCSVCLNISVITEGLNISVITEGSTIEEPLWIKVKFFLVFLHQYGNFINQEKSAYAIMKRICNILLHYYNIHYNKYYTIIILLLYNANIAVSFMLCVCGTLRITYSISWHLGTLYLYGNGCAAKYARATCSISWHMNQCGNGCAANMHVLPVVFPGT